MLLSSQGANVRQINGDWTVDQTAPG